MVKDPQIKLRPWCPFCGIDVGKPREPVHRKMNEFTVGTCQCGALYTCDPTGFNVGAAMVEAIVHACNDNWDLAWELLPDHDYLTGRIDNYDEQTHQVYPNRNVDGRKVSGVLYFVRLNQDIASLSQNIQTQHEEIGKALIPSDIDQDIPDPEPLRPEKRAKKRAEKARIAAMAEAGEFDELVDLAMDDLRTLRFIQRLLYDPDEAKRWWYAHVLGQVCRRLSTRRPGAVSDLLHRLFEACADSAASHWGLIESVGSIIAARADLYGGFARHILMYRSTDSSCSQVLWALGSIAQKRPDIVRATPFYSLLPLIDHPNPTIRALAVRLFGRITATEVAGTIEKLRTDSSEVIIYEEGRPVQTSVAALAEEAWTRLQQKQELKP